MLLLMIFVIYVLSLVIILCKMSQKKKNLLVWILKIYLRSKTTEQIRKVVPSQASAAACGRHKH